MMTLPVVRSVGLLALSLFTTVVTCDPNAPCYSPKGLPTPGYYPCDPTAYITSCCPQGWTCFSNSLCVVTTESKAFPNLTVGDVTRGTCTNPLWNNNICGDYCLDDANAKGDMAACGNDKFCCGHDFDTGACNCSSKGGALTIRPGRAQTIIAVTDTSFTGSPTYASPTRHTTASPTGASGATAETTSVGGSSNLPSTFFSSTTKPSRSTTSSLSSSSHSITGGTAVSSQASNQNGTTDAGSSGGSGNNKALKIGLGVGIPLALLAIAGGILAYVFWYRKQRRNGDEIPVVADGWGTNDDLAENDRADSPALSRNSPPMAQNRP